MKRFALILGLVGLLSLFSTEGYAQFKKGDNLLNVGFGLNSYYSGGIPLSVAYEYGVSSVVSVGGGLDYLSYHYGTPNNNYSFTALYLGGRVSYHFNQVFNINDRQWDIYGGGSLGYRSFTWGDNLVTGYGDSYSSGLYLGIHGGARYYFSQKAGAFLEVGALGSSNIRIGVTFRF